MTAQITPLPRLLTLAAAARELACSTKHVGNLIRAGELEAIGYRRGRRVLSASLDDYIERQRRREDS